MMIKKVIFQKINSWKLFILGQLNTCKYIYYVLKKYNHLFAIPLEYTN